MKKPRRKKAKLPPRFHVNDMTHWGAVELSHGGFIGMGLTPAGWFIAGYTSDKAITKHICLTHEAMEVLFGAMMSHRDHRLLARRITLPETK